jgi:hypothetical protein
MGKSMMADQGSAVPYAWFESVILLECATPELLATMAWIYASAGNGLEFWLDGNETQNIARQIGSTRPRPSMPLSPS